MCCSTWMATNSWPSIHPGFVATKAIRTDIDFYGFHRAQQQYSPRGRRALVLRLHGIDLARRQTTGSLHRAAIQTSHLCDQQMGQGRWPGPTERWVRYLREHFPTMAYRADCLYHRTDRQERQSVAQPRANALQASLHRRVPTNAINRLIKAALKQHNTAMMYGKRPKIYFASQISTNPPTIVMMCNNPAGL